MRHNVMHSMSQQRGTRHSGFPKLGAKQKKVKYLVHSFGAECLQEQSFHLSGCWKIGSLVCGIPTWLSLLDSALQEEQLHAGTRGGEGTGSQHCSG